MDKEIDCSCTDEVVCPYCGYEYSDSWEFDDSGEIDCDECNKKFSYEKNHHIDYSTSKMDCTSEHDYAKARPHLTYTKYTYNRTTRKFEQHILPEDRWEYLEWFDCKNCDCFKTEPITREEFLTKYPEKYELYQKWIARDRLTLPLYDE